MSVHHSCPKRRTDTGFPVSLAGKHLPCSVKVFGEYASETIEFSFVVNEVPDPSIIGGANKLSSFRSDFS